MDSFSDSSRYELDSVTSTESLQFITDEFHLRHVSTPDVSNAELSKRAALLELENERLRLDLENTRIDLTARLAATQGLKDKITEQFMEAQASLQERLKLENALKEAKSRVAAAEHTAKWYQTQLHELQASKRSLQLEIDYYQHVANCRQQSVLELTARCKQLNSGNVELSQKLRQEKQHLMEEIRALRAQETATAVPVDETPTRFSPDLSTKLEVTEEELRDTRAAVKNLEQRLLSCEVTKASVESALSKHRELIFSMEDNVRKCELEKSRTAGQLSEANLEVEKLRAERNGLQATVLSCKQEQGQVEQGIVQLRSQLSKMIAQYKLIKARNGELEEKINSAQDFRSENQRLKTLSFAANNSLLRKLREAKRRIRSLETQLSKERDRIQYYESKNETNASMRECLQRALERNKEMKERFKAMEMTKISDESIDEGYGDGCILSLAMNIPSPATLNPVLLHSISRVLSNSKDFLAPVQSGLSDLRSKMEKLQDSQYIRSVEHILPSHNSRQIAPSSPQNNARSVA